jgi:V/A-type H+-transporting ATPase subunit C
MIARVFRYANIQARTRTLKGKLLSPEDWYYLQKMRGLDEFLRYLRTTEYAPFLSGFSDSTAEAGRISLALHDALFGDYAKVLKAVPEKSAILLRSLLLRYEAENIKTILRGIWQTKSIAEIRPLLYRLGGLSSLPWEDLLAVRQVTDLLDLLKPTLYYLPLMYAFPQFEAQGRLFPLEITLDRLPFEHLSASLKSLKGLNERGARILVGEFIDGVNVVWLVRLRHFYGLSAEEAINYSLPGGLRLSVRDLGKLARVSELSDFLEELPEPYRMSLTSAQRWQQIQPLFQRRLVDELYRSFQGDPFQVRLPTAYLLLKEREVKSLESLASALEIGESPNEIVSLIGWPLRGNARV